MFMPDPAFADASTRRVVLLGAPPPQRLPETVAVETVDCGGLDLFASVALLRARLRGLPLPAGGERFDGLAQLARRMAACRYGVVVWAVGHLEMAGGDLLVEQMHQLVIDLNHETRWAGLPLAGNEADLTANAVATWQTGFPLPIEFAGGRIVYDPFPDYSDADLLVWLGALPGVGGAAVPGAPDNTQQLVIGAPSQAADLPARHVFIPVATPGVTASGHLVRTDGVITLYAPAVQASPLPAAATIIDGITSALEGVVA
jgi:formylmethanofuran dehydrogenase subunit B